VSNKIESHTDRNISLAFWFLSAFAIELIALSAVALAVLR